MSTLDNYLEYHRKMWNAKDIDPSIICLKYIADRFELNIEQRFWLAFLYATCYCSTTVFYMYNEFPDYENVDIGRLTRWWVRNKSKTIFQTDRLRIKTSDAFVECYQSYKELLGNLSQKMTYFAFFTPNKYVTYDEYYAFAKRIRNFGRFTLFNYLEAVQVLSGWNFEPRDLDLKEAESCRNGLAYAIGRPDLSNHLDKRKLTKGEMEFLQGELPKVVVKVKAITPMATFWNIETTLCAYKKFMLGKRFVGYYITRQYEEIKKMEKLVPDGVDWSVLWDFRRETFKKHFLKEYDYEHP